MLIRIHVKQLRLGMFVHELCGSWMDHPFWRGAFLLDNPHDLKTILSTGLKEVWIDDSKGLGVEGGEDEEAIAAKVDSTLAQADTTGKFFQYADVAQEAVRAIKICAKSKQAVASMFNEARMGKALSADDTLPIVEEISTSLMRNPGALIGLARLKNKDDYTYMHSVAVCALMVSLARQMGLNDEQIRQAGLAGLLHDVGKMMIPLDILNKPGKLTDTEFETIKSHPAEGHKMLLKGSGIGDVALDVCLHHHEKVDGSGYPERLPDAQISRYAKMGAVCDVYDAITSNHPYKNGWEPAESIRKMAEWSTGHFDTTIFHAFVKSVGIYPIGSLVKLESGHLGVIIEQTGRIVDPADLDGVLLHQVQQQDHAGDTGSVEADLQGQDRFARKPGQMGYPRRPGVMERPGCHGLVAAPARNLFCVYNPRPPRGAAAGLDISPPSGSDVSTAPIH